jgi:hypothetical protein
MTGRVCWPLSSAQCLYSLGTQHNCRPHHLSPYPRASVGGCKVTSRNIRIHPGLGPSSRVTVSSNSVTVIRPGAGCSTTSTITVSRTGSFRTSFPGAFFTAARFGLDLATVRFVAFADFATVAALPRLAEFPLRSLPRFCTFALFFRLAMIAPHWCSVRIQPSKSRQTIERELSTDRGLSLSAQALFFPQSDWGVPAAERKVGRKWR